MALAEVEGAEAGEVQGGGLDMPTLVTEHLVESPEKQPASGRPVRDDLDKDSGAEKAESKEGKKKKRKKHHESGASGETASPESDVKSDEPSNEPKSAEPEAHEGKSEEEAKSEEKSEKGETEEAKSEEKSEKEETEEAKSEEKSEKEETDKDRKHASESDESQEKAKTSSDNKKSSESSDSEDSHAQKKEDDNQNETEDTHNHEPSEEMSTTTLEDDFLSESSTHPNPQSKRQPNVMEQLQELRKTAREGGYSARNEWVQLDDESCMNRVKNFERKGQVPVRNERDAVLKYIRREVTRAMANKEYKKADHMDDINTRLLAAIAEADKAEYAVDRGEIIGSEIQATKDRMAESEKQWQGKFQTMRQNEEQKEEELKRTHKEQVRDFDEYYDDVDHLRAYSKPSPYLLHLRYRERSMVMCNRFMEAKAMSNEADQIEKAEAAKAQALAHHDIMEKRSNLLKKQAGEVQRARNYYDKHVEKNKKEMEKEMTMFQRRLTLLERTKEAGTTESIDFYATCPEPPGVRSPRTRKQYNEFRSTAPVGKLKLQPLLGLASKCPKPVRPRVTKTAVATRK